MEAAVLGNLQKSFIVINIPPRVGKTKMIEALCSWLLAYFSDSQIIYVSYSNELAKTSVRYIQETMAAQWYQDLFETRLGQIRQADHFTTTGGGKVYGDGVGGSLTGLGAGLKRRAGGFIVLDDPAKPDEALSQIEGGKLRFWLNNTLLSRRNSSQWTPIFVVCQRLSTDDLPGFLLENYPNDVELIKFPAMVNGESVIPETVTTAELLNIERVNPFAFASQYLQEPVILGGNLIKLDNFHHYDTESPPKFELKIMTCDTALKAKESNDYSVCQCWGRSLKRAFLIDQIRGKWSPAELLANVHRFYQKHHKASSPMSFIAIEEAAAGFALIQEMRKRGIPAKGLVRQTDKVSRVNVVLPFIEVGLVYLPRQAHYLSALELELASFRRDGKSAQDDCCDCLADAVFMLLGKGTSILSVVGGKKGAYRLGVETG
jgi:predicted phage terminase large subunit-like protein